MLIEVGGWRLLTDPTFDPPGERYRFGWGTASRKVAGPALAAADLGRIDAVLLTHDHHGDNLDPAGRALLPSAEVIVTQPRLPCYKLGVRFQADDMVKRFLASGRTRTRTDVSMTPPS